MSDDETRDWRRLALTLADALEEIRRLKGCGLPAEPEPKPAEPKPALPSEIRAPMAQRLERLRKIRVGDRIIARGPTDMGFAVFLQFDGTPGSEGRVGAFALTRHYSPDSGTWEGQGYIRSVTEWAADGWDIADGGRA